MVKNPPANPGDTRDVGLIPGLGRSLGEGNDNPLQYSCLGNPMDRESWRVTVHGVAKNQTGLSDFAFTFHFHGNSIFSFIRHLHTFLYSGCTNLHSNNSVSGFPFLYTLSSICYLQTFKPWPFCPM